MKRILLFLAMGVLVGEILSLFALPTGEDFWGAYLIARLQTGRISQEQLRVVWPYPYGYYDPGFRSLLAIPLSLLDPFSALVIWIAVSYLAIAAATYLWMKNSRVYPSFGLPTTILLFLAWPVTFEHMFRGQFSWLFLLAMVGSYVLGDKKKDLPAGLALSLGLSKPLLLAAVAGGLAFKAKWRILMGLAVGSLLLLGASLLITPPQIETDFTHYLTHLFFGFPYSVSLVGRLYFLPWPLQAAASMVGFVTLAMWWWRTGSPTIFQAAFGCTASLLFIPHLRTYDLVILIPVLTLLPLEKDRLAQTSMILLSLGALGSLRFALLDVVTLSLILLLISLWRAGASGTPAQ